ncbi:NAD(P)H-dependent oxidoreductase [Chryseobacterium chendengshani]|uniref:NAD(P)H-dependent oxidoreductase n=1 Tax=Chryseobacterium sp. LJ668 TaxID=2864040 RepID=UPI001C687BF9|nr:NAD(P)H-dependent oxidoreductase [Chryseobacterium sp. LJ668]MBW8523516.1 NAD(P)H-dependent oxidoreductase [Chryseobacterium sp. LJ668]QYK15799.1 NAD(P)H-dependent oxidoreductase [Chryseobacterium sp. LJ668]
MKILIILAHPEPKSFNAAMYHSAIKTLEENGHEVKTSDLYRMNFNPVSDRNNFTTMKNDAYFNQQAEEHFANENNGFADDILAEQDKVEWCDLMIWQFPLWWFSVPAILKGWVDKVFTMGRFYDNGRIYDTGMLKGKKALLSLTTGGPEKNYVTTKYGSADQVLHPIETGILEFAGLTVLSPEINFSIERITDEERKMILEKWSHRLNHIFAE